MKLFRETGQVKQKSPMEDMVYMPHISQESEIYVGKFNVTVDEWALYCAATGKELPNINADSNGPQHPVVNITVFEMCEYCNWLNESVGSVPNQKGEMVELTFRYIIGEDITVNNPSFPGFRLPDEATWLKVTEDYPPEDIDQYVWYGGNSGGHSHPVGTKLPNSYGLFDTAGNVYDTVVSSEEVE